MKYIPLALSCGLNSDTPEALFAQHTRFCTGSVSLLLKGGVYKSSLTMIQKICYYTGFLRHFTFINAIFLEPFFFMISSIPCEDGRDPGFYRVLLTVPEIAQRFFFFPRWTTLERTENAKFTLTIVRYARLRAMYDLAVGNEFVWLATGDKKAHRNYKYRNTHRFAVAWTLVSNVLVLVRIVYCVGNGMAWIGFVPRVIMVLFHLYLDHRYLLFTRT